MTQTKGDDVNKGELIPGFYTGLLQLTLSLQEYQFLRCVFNKLLLVPFSQYCGLGAY